MTDPAHQTLAMARDTSSIDDLPVETLTHVLLHLRDVDPPQAAREASTKGPALERKLGWVNATHVSRYWRDTTLSNPLFWTRVPFNIGQDWASTFVQRCLSLPLDISLDLDSYGLATWIEALLVDNFHRTRTLKVGFWNGSRRIEDPIYALLERPSTILETLSLDRTWRQIEPPRLRSAQYPQLRSLNLILDTLYAEDFPWRDLGTPKITDLSIKVGKPTHITRILPDIMSCLQGLQALISLKLDFAGPRYGHPAIPELVDDGTDHSLVPSVFLPVLENFTLRADAGAAVIMLQHISSPTTTLLTLFSHGPLKREPFASLLRPVISAQSERNPFRHLSFYDNDDEDHTMHIAAASSTPKLPLSHRNAGQNTRLYLDFSETVDFFPDILSVLGSEMMYHVEIHCTLERSLTSDTLLPCIPVQFRNVTCLSFAMPKGQSNPRITPNGIIVATMRRSLLPTADASYPPFPKLAALDLSFAGPGVLMARCMHPEDAKPKRLTMPPTFAQAIADIMTARRDAGFRVPQVYVPEWTKRGTTFEETVYEVICSIPEVVFMPNGAHIVVDETSGEVRME
ncbi:unnamed protein product [Peniophora sp. CBMAI 1063]|nr:unnamed protein product [Peniophora sp. CBMAI 1063]